MFGDPISNEKKWNLSKMELVAPVMNYKGEFENNVWLLNLDMIEAGTGSIIDYNIVPKEMIKGSVCTFDETNVLYSKLRPYLNKVVIPLSKGYATSELVPLRPLKAVLERYYFTYMLRSKKFLDFISEKVVGAKMPRVAMDVFRSLEIPLPPLYLQNEFADKVKLIDKSKFVVIKSINKSFEICSGVSLLQDFIKRGEKNV